MKIRLCETTSGLKHPYGHLNERTRDFILVNIGKTFTAKRDGMNYYTLENGMKVHIYNGVEVLAQP